MKRLAFFGIILFSFSSLFSQSDINLTINHKMGDQDFKDSLVMFAGTDSQYFLNRVQYYISSVTLTDQSDKKHKLDDLYILVTAKGASDTYTLLSNSMDITTVKNIEFAIGVDSQTNHLDPAQYGTFHPLALKVPSMHWGWAGGYRFLALEGKAGNGFKQKFEIHGVGNENYFLQNHNVNVNSSDGKINIELTADYNATLENFDLESGLVSHGTTEASLCLKYFSNRSFKSSNASSSITTIDKEKVSIWSFGDQLYVNTNNRSLEIEVIDMTGKTIEKSFVKNLYVKPIDISGIYFVKVMNENEIIDVKKVMINK